MLELQAIAGFFEQSKRRRTSRSGSRRPAYPRSLAKRSGLAMARQTVFPLVGLDRLLHRPSLRDIRRRSGLSKRRRAAVADGPFQTDICPAITFTSAPGAGVAITADFGILWLCRFAEDVQDFEEFMTMLWTLRTVRLMTVRP